MPEKDFSFCTLDELIGLDTCRAAILHQLGIPFYEFLGNTLAEVCAKKGIRLDHVVRELNAPTHHLHPDEKLLIAYPAELIIGCLRHAHGIFMRHRLPYIGNLIEHFELSGNSHASYHSLITDLKILFPVFAQDFVEHIHMEEDTLFAYIEKLNLVIKGKLSSTKIYHRMEKESIHRFIAEHEAHDDEMEGIREITNQYSLESDCPLHIKVLFGELQLLERDLHEHARIENEILFPKAISLEGRVSKIIRETSHLN